MYVIRRADQGGGYLKQSGSRNMWTHDLRLARTFATWEAAQAECCPGNEVPASLDALLQQPQ